MKNHFTTETRGRRKSGNFVIGKYLMAITSSITQLRNYAITNSFRVRGKSIFAP
jgi:hypothetical protein